MSCEIAETTSLVLRKRALFKSYYASTGFDDRVWLPSHSTRCHFRFETRNENDSRTFIRIRTSISGRRDLKAMAVKLEPCAIYFTPIEWLDPVHLRLTRKEVRDCMLTSPLYFDIDAKKSPKSRVEASRTIVCKLMEVVHEWSNRSPDMLVFSGKSGFHVYYWTWDDIPTKFGHPKERIAAFIRSRKELINRLRLEGIIIDETVTADPWRVLRLPGSLHWETGLVACKVLNLNDFKPQRDALVFPAESYKEVFGLDLTRL